MKRLTLLVLLLAIIAIAPIAARQAHAKKEVSALEKILNSAGNTVEGKLEIKKSRYRKRHSNIEEERWDVMVKIRNNASISSNCNIMLQVFNSSGRMLDEYLIVNDSFPYESVVTYEDNIYVKRSHIPLISFARYSFSCIKKSILGR